MGKKNSKENSSDIDPTTWMVTFGDLLMLLLTFFVMLLTMSSMDTKSLKSMVSLFQGASGPLELGGDLREVKAIEKLRSGTHLRTSSLEMLELMKGVESNIAISAGKSGARVTSTKMLEDFFLTGDDEKDEQILIGLESIMQFSDDERGVVISFQANVMFDSGEAEIKKGFYPTLDIVAKILKTVPNDVLVMGHTDNVPIRHKRYGSNWELSLYRALNAQKYFVEEKGLSPKRFGVGGYGDVRPQLSNDTEEGRNKNRRVEIILRRE